MPSKTPHIDAEIHLRRDPAHCGFLGTHAKIVRPTLLALARETERILHLGGSDDGLVRDLSERGFRTVGIHPDFTAARGQVASYSDAILTSLDRTDSHDPRFDLVIAADHLGRVCDPALLLIALRDNLQPRGRLVITVPNAAHERFANALALGQPFYDPSGPIDREQFQLFTKDSLIQSLEDAGFCVGQVEPISGKPTAANGVAGWLAVAHLLPEPDMAWVQSCIRESANARLLAETRSDQLEDRHAEAMLMLDAAYARVQNMTTQLSAAQTQLRETHDHLLRRDREHHDTIKQLLNARDASELQRAASETHFAALQDALEAWHSRSEEEFEASKQALVAERDAAFAHALAAEARCRALELRAEHVLMEVPRRALRSIKRWMRARSA